MKNITAEDAVTALKKHKLFIPAAELAAIMGTCSRAVATALRGPVNDGRVSQHYKKGVAFYRFVRQKAKKGGADATQHQASPKQEAQEPANQKDADRYRWLRDESWAGYNLGKGMPHVVMSDAAGNRKSVLAEAAMDAAIDAAMVLKKGGAA